MCYYIGIEDLAANALIEILKDKSETEYENYPVTFKELEEYGAAVIRYLNKEKNQEALLVLSGARTVHMFRNYSDFFEEIETEKGNAIRLQKGKTVKDLVSKFRAYNAFDVARAFAVTAQTIINAAG